MPLCPACHVSLITEFDEPPWCERCEFNLGHFRPDPDEGPLARRMNVWAARLAFASNRRLFAEIAGREVKKPEITPAFVLLLGISLFMMSFLISLVITGVLMIIDGHWLIKTLGALLIGVAIVLRPRLGSLKPYRAEHDEITREEAPQLFALIDRAASLTGAPRPHHVFVSAAWNAHAAVVGLRRQRVLVLGVPLWVCLNPQERVAVLGHELGHFTNKDVRRGLLTQPACTMFGELAYLVRPDHMAVPNESSSGEGYVATNSGGIFAAFGMLLVKPLMWAAFYVLAFIHIGIHMISARDAQRAEYYADYVAATLAGSKANSYLDMALRTNTYESVIGSRTRAGEGFAGWRTAIAQARESRSVRIGRLLQLSLRDEASPFRAHPPAGLRRRLLDSLPFRDAAMVLTDAEAERIDTELTRFEKRYQREIAHSW